MYNTDDCTQCKEWIIKHFLQEIFNRSKERDKGIRGQIGHWQGYWSHLLLIDEEIKDKKEKDEEWRM